MVQSYRPDPRMVLLGMKTTCSPNWFAVLVTGCGLCRRRILGDSFYVETGDTAGDTTCVGIIAVGQHDHSDLVVDEACDLGSKTGQRATVMNAFVTLQRIQQPTKAVRIS